MSDMAPRVCKPEPCPRCGEEDDIWPELQGEPFGLYCRACQWGGPRVAKDEDTIAALLAWDDEARKVRLAQELGLKVNLTQAEVPHE
jgi:hypothetical protein